MTRRTPSRINADRQRFLIEILADILREGRPTYFAFEASARHGLRVRLISEGWRWADADSAAAELIERALKRIGAVRPTWLQGQPGYTEAGHAPVALMQCRRCGLPLDATGARGWHLQFCSTLCRDRFQSGRNLNDQRRNFDAMVSAALAHRANDTRSCDHCGRVFTTTRHGGAVKAFCSPHCSNSFHLAARRRHVPCAHCGKPFTPRNIVRAPKYCSQECFRAARWGERRKAQITCEPVE